MKTYTIRSGATFRVSDTQVLQGGEQIDLADDVAAAHADKLEPVAPEAAAEAAPQASAQAAFGES